MTKQYFCSKCHLELTVTRKALKEYGRIVELVEPHECSDEVHEIKFDSRPLNTFDTSYKDKIDQNLINLGIEPGDRRSLADVKSTAPSSLLDKIKTLSNSIPEHEETEPSED